MIADGVDESGPYMIFEWVDGTDLEQVLSGVARKENPLPLNQAILIGYYLAQGLSYLHNLKDENGKHLGLIHRDLSPGNVLISNQGDVKIADFGIAKSKLKETQTVVGELKGKFAYMAPEQTRGQAMDHRVDLFALGIVMWECCMAQSLFDAANNLDVVNRVRERQAPTLITLRSDMPPELSDLIHQLLEKEPHKRPKDADEVVKKLEAIVYAQGLFDGHKRILAKLAKQYPRTVSFDHVPSGGATQKTTAKHQASEHHVVVKEIEDSTQLAPTVVTAPSSKGLLFVGLAVMILLGVLIGLNLSPPAPTPVEASANMTSGPQAQMPVKTPVTTVPTHKAPNEPKPPTQPIKKTRPGTHTPSRGTQKAMVSPQGFGTLQLTSSPWGWVSIDGKKLKKHTPIRDLQLPAGKHRLRIFNPELKLEQTLEIEITADQKLIKKINLSTGTVR